MSHKSAFVLVVALICVLAGGCEHYNRADVSPDGRRIGFALNDKGGFETDASSELYVVTLDDDPTRLAIKRLTRNRVCDAWAAFSPDGAELLAWRDEPMSIFRYQADSGEESPVMASAVQLTHFPSYVDEDVIF